MRLKDLLALDPINSKLVELMEIKLAHNWEADKEELEQKQKARANWLKFEDRNTPFFHNFAKQWKRKNIMTKLKAANKSLIEEEAAKLQITIDYFTKLFEAS